MLFICFGFGYSIVALFPSSSVLHVLQSGYKHPVAAPVPLSRPVLKSRPGRRFALGKLVVLLLHPTATTT
jgi:hypothetical protein